MGWVTKRRDCTLKAAFDELQDLAEKDVKEFNDNVAGKGSTYRIVPGTGTKERFYVQENPSECPSASDKRCIKFELNNNHILVDRSGPDTLTKLPNLTIKQKWDWAKSECVLCVSGKACSASEACQIALEPVFFE